MNRKYLIPIAGCLVVAVAIAWRCKIATGDQSHPMVDASARAAPHPSAVPTTTAALPASIQVDRSKREMMRDVLTNLNHQPIEFYGRVIDQYDMPVGDAEVDGQIIYNTGAAAGVEKPTTVTDANGYFQFEGFSGRTLDFTVTKPGYQFTPEGDAFDYTRLKSEEKRHHPDPKNPVVVRMWKLQGAETLVHGGKVIRIVPDGTPVEIDFQARKIVKSGGDLIIALEHPRYPRGTLPVPRYDWVADIKIINGGFIEATQRIDNMLLAPEEGYVPSLRMSMPASRQDWTTNGTKNVYAKTRGNVYSKLVINIECSAMEDTSYVQLTWWVNPSGSRNLEYDPAKQVKK